MYSNIDIKIVIDFILEKIYSNPESFFTEFEESENGDEPTIKIIPKHLMKEFFTKTLTKFSSFSTLDGFFRQRSGLSMGGKLSSPLSNIFMNILEQKVIKNIFSKEILYSTHVSWMTHFCALKKALKTKFLQK